MGIAKQDFYEGAAIYALARCGQLACIRYEAPFFVVNDRILILLKYSTKVRSPWAFTFSPEEQRLLRSSPDSFRTIVGLVCGSDGVVALPLEAYCLAATARDTSVHISCYRRHREHYEVGGPDGPVAGKIAPSDWRRILENGEGEDATSR